MIIKGENIILFVGYWLFKYKIENYEFVIRGKRRYEGGVVVKLILKFSFFVRNYMISYISVW